MNEYILVTCDKMRLLEALEGLEERVMLHYDEGWKPIGAPQILKCHSSNLSRADTRLVDVWVVTQAMTRYTPENTEVPDAR